MIGSADGILIKENYMVSRPFFPKEGDHIKRLFCSKYIRTHLQKAEEMGRWMPSEVVDDVGVINIFVSRPNLGHGQLVYYLMVRRP